METPESDFLRWMGAFSERGEGEALSERFPSHYGRSESSRQHSTPLASFENEVEKCLYLCAKLYLQDGVLVKVDRASMANSLEVRAPFLDPDLVEFAARCPLEYKMTPDANEARSPQCRAYDLAGRNSLGKEAWVCSPDRQMDYGRPERVVQRHLASRPHQEGGSV